MFNHSRIKKVAQKNYSLVLETARPAVAPYQNNASALSLHSVEGFLKNLEIACVPGFFAGRLDPFLLQ
jgi:hypothetical protein